MLAFDTTVAHFAAALCVNAETLRRIPPGPLTRPISRQDDLARA